MTNIEWISLASSIGVLLTALVALCTLFELFRQRKQTYKPDLCLLQKSFHLKGGESEYKNLALNWCASDKDEEKDFLSHSSLQLVNIGFGAAKKVEATWTFNYVDLIKIINKLAQKQYHNFYIEKEDAFLNIKSDQSSMYGVNAEMNTWNYEYILPFNSHKNTHDIPLPPSYTMLLSTYLSLWIKEYRNFEDIELPSLTLQLTYEDIGKGKHNSKHCIKCDLHRVLEVPPESKDRCSEFYIKLVEIS